jgi:hypothetical protein
VACGRRTGETSGRIAGVHSSTRVWQDLVALLRVLGWRGTLRIVSGGRSCQGGDGHFQKTSPSKLCLGGKRAAPPEECGGAWAYLQRVDRHHVPLDAMATVAAALERLLKADDQTTVRQVIGDPETFREAVAQLDVTLNFGPNTSIVVM